MKLRWADMKKAERAFYLEHRDEQREIEMDKEFAEARAREALRKEVLASLAASGSMVVKALDLEYLAGDYLLWNGVKGGGNRGFGWSELRIPSQLVLVVEALGRRLELRVGRHFQYHIGRLTEKHRNLIRQAMPTAVELVPGVDPKNGDPLILVSPQALSRWLDDVLSLRCSMREKTSA